MKSLTTSSKRVTELESERNELTVKIRSYKSEISSLKEQYSSKMTQFETMEAEHSQLTSQVREFSSKYEHLQKVEVEYKSFKSETEDKMGSFNDLSRQVRRLQDEITQKTERLARQEDRLAE